MASFHSPNEPSPPPPPLETREGRRLRLHGEQLGRAIAELDASVEAMKAEADRLPRFTLPRIDFAVPLPRLEEPPAEGHPYRSAPPRRCLLRYEPPPRSFLVPWSRAVLELLGLG